MAVHELEHQVPGPRPPLGPAAHRGTGAVISVLNAARRASPGWMARSACRGEDPELFFPVATTGPALTQISSAKAICGRCPVQSDCLSFALITGQDGIWGGTTRDERVSAARHPGGRRHRGGPQ